jgi:hypothetical protein
MRSHCGSCTACYLHCMQLRLCISLHKVERAHPRRDCKQTVVFKVYRCHLGVTVGPQSSGSYTRVRQNTGALQLPKHAAQAIIDIADLRNTSCMSGRCRFGRDEVIVICFLSARQTTTHAHFPHAAYSCENSLQFCQAFSSAVLLARALSPSGSRAHAPCLEGVREYRCHQRGIVEGTVNDQLRLAELALSALTCLRCAAIATTRRLA